jgi:hypothetical protein
VEVTEQYQLKKSQTGLQLWRNYVIAGTIIVIEQIRVVSRRVHFQFHKLINFV